MTNPETLEETRSAVVKALEDSAQDVVSALAEAPAELLERKPAPEKWSARDVVCHMTDTDTRIFLMRIGRFESEVSPVFPDIDHETWEKEHGYASQPIDAAVEAFLFARKDLMSRLLRLPDEVWQRTGHREGLGPVRVADVAAYCAKHTLVHSAQIRRTITELKSAQS